MKVSFFDKRVLNKFYLFLSAVSVVTSIVLIFFEIDDKYKYKAGIIALALLVLIYISIWIFYNRLRCVRLKINNSEVEVKFGDIFREKADLKVIAFNEYFDTKVDNVMISENSLNGIYINQYFKNNVNELDRIISEDSHLSDMKVDEDIVRIHGKREKYKLGTICVVNDFLLTAFTHFDNDNKATLDMVEYIQCLLNFWNEVDRIYAGRTVVLPILGSGITRFKNYETICDQELLELILWTFKISRIKFAYPSKMKVVVWEQKQDKVNLLDLKKLGN